ncbi:MAG: hypothetical protein WC484_03240 [Candidatus Omnitrophota bacterium]
MEGKEVLLDGVPEEDLERIEGGEEGQDEGSGLTDQGVAPGVGRARAKKSASKEEALSFPAASRPGLFLRSPPASGEDACRGRDDHPGDHHRGWPFGGHAVQVAQPLPGQRRGRPAPRWRGPAAGPPATPRCGEGHDGGGEAGRADLGGQADLAVHEADAASAVGHWGHTSAIKHILKNSEEPVTYWPWVLRW